MPTTTMQEIEAIIKETQTLQRENAQQIKASTARMEASDRELKESLKKLREELGGMGSSNGEYAEDYFANAMEKKKVFAGQYFDDFNKNVKGKAGDTQDEFDIVLYNGEAVALIEIKYKARPEDLKKMVTKKVSNFRTLFPYYKNHKVYLGLGSMSFNDRVSTKAHELGIGLLKQVGETVEVEPGYVKAY
jgi:hypothetical protein